MSELHVDKCCQHRWTLNVINWRRLSVYPAEAERTSTFVYV